jgi:nucleotide-binding universal stress UspA family protein
METFYNNILVPIGDALNTQKALARAISLAGPCRSTIHLAHLIHTWNPFATLTPATAYDADSKDALDRYIKTLLEMMRWKDFVRKQAQIVQVKIHIMRGPSVNAFIHDLTQRTPIDLIIVTNNKRWKRQTGAQAGPGDLIARETHCAVLSLNTQKKRGIREDIEMLSEPLVVPCNTTNGKETRVLGLTGVFGKLSSN